MSRRRIESQHDHTLFFNIYISYLTNRLPPGPALPADCRRRQRVSASTRLCQDRDSHSRRHRDSACQAEIRLPDHRIAPVQVDAVWAAGVTESVICATARVSIVGAVWLFHHPVIFCAGHGYWRTVLSSKRFLSPDSKYRASNRQNHHMLVFQQDAHPAPGNRPFRCESLAT